MKRRTWWITGAVAVVLIAITVSVVGLYGRSLWVPLWLKLRGARSLETVVQGLEQGAARARLQPALAQAGFTELPPRLALVAIKDTQHLEMWGALPDEPWRRIKVYPFAGFSGVLGPKLREGDRQIPEGVYRVAFLNPNSAYHLSLRVDYPNAFDQAHAAVEGRTELGGDIMIHGGNRTVGCIPIGDDEIEEVFLCVAHATAAANAATADSAASGTRPAAVPAWVPVIIAPVDLRGDNEPPDLPDLPWAPALYAGIAAEMMQFGGGRQGH